MAKAKLDVYTLQDENDDDFTIIKVNIPKKQLCTPRNECFFPLNTDEARTLGKALIKLAAEIDSQEG